MKQSILVFLSFLPEKKKLIDQTINSIMQIKGLGEQGYLALTEYESSSLVIDGYEVRFLVVSFKEKDLEDLKWPEKIKGLRELLGDQLKDEIEANSVKFQCIIGGKSIQFDNYE